MTRAWRLRAAPVAMLLVAACQDTPTTPLELLEDDEGGLTFLVPDLDPSMLVVASVEVLDSLAAAPARVIEEHEGEPDWGSAPAASDIWDAYTTVGFQPGSAWASGQHMYQGNKGKVTTTVRVFLDGTEIGQQSAHTLQDIFFLADFGLAKHIQAIARAFVSQECGLTARGDSLHEAWWEPLPAVDITSFGRSALTSYTFEPARQPACQPKPPKPDSSGGEGGLCWINVWYDRDTGEIVDWEILYCEPIGG